MTAQAPWDLTALGWSSAAWDTCWLECDRPGFCRQVNGMVICLCENHAHFLESGRFRGSYDGAPLPPSTMLASWPWRDASTIDDDVPEDARMADPEPAMMGADASGDAGG